METVQEGLGMAYLLLGMVMGVLMGWLLAGNRAVKAADARVDEKLADLRETTEKETRARVERVVRDEITHSVRDELREKYEDEIRQEAERESRHLLDDAQAEAGGIVKDAEIEAKEIILAAREEADQEERKRRKELERVESRLEDRGEALDTRAAKLDQREEELDRQEQSVNDRKRAVAEREETIVGQEAQLAAELERVAEFTRDEARNELVERMTGDAKIEANKRIRRIEEEATEEADKRAKKILSIAIQRWAGEYVVERTVSVVQLPSDDMKGRIIGREGRNIRAFEAATGMDVIIDDTPEAVVVSGFDPVRRHIATLSMQKLISDGRIHPSHIEEIVEKTREEVGREIKEHGEQAGFELGIHGLHPDLIKLLGRLRYRTSYGQNMWSHSIEVGFLCGLMASELGVDVKRARRAGLLHDIGKALTHERDGSHALIGAEIAKKCGEEEIVRNAIAAHHNEEPQNSVIAHLVIAADALSGARPGARREILETYVQRLRDLERISADFAGVERSYAIQAGREIRVMVENSKVDDDQAFALSKEIARKIEDELTYPGQIKVCVIRETRAIDYAR
jgi:ribonuclease Y